jgi:hypothetical protein
LRVGIREVLMKALVGMRAVLFAEALVAGIVPRAGAAPVLCQKKLSKDALRRSTGCCIAATC